MDNPRNAGFIGWIKGTCMIFLALILLISGCTSQTYEIHSRSDTLDQNNMIIDSSDKELINTYE